MWPLSRAPADAPGLDFELGGARLPSGRARLARYEAPLALAGIAALAWLAQFHHFRDF